MKSFKVFVIFAAVSIANCQSDGAFWWLNKNVMKGAAESRSINENSNSKIRTLPPRYRKESDQKTTTTTAKNSIFVDEDEEDRKMFKYDDEPDCVCTPKHLCSENNTVITDGAGVIDERSYNFCGKDNVCCRLQKSTEQPSTTTQKVFVTTAKITTTTVRKGILNFISTILKPVAPSNFQTVTQPQKCVSRKGKKIEKRILIDNDYDEDEAENDDGALVGETNFAEYPWMIEILKKNRKTNNFEYKCGGVLINPTTVLTANHCLKGSQLKPSNFLIRAGEWDRSSTLEYAPHYDRPVTQVIAHPQYYSGGLFNDIALLKWQEPLANEVNVAPICLPDESEVFEAGKYCTVTGWGKTADTSKTTDKLKFVKVPIVNRQTCERQFQQNRLGARFKLHESFICAGGEEGKDSCENDGGSPLICPRTDGSFVLTGLVSWGLDCGQKNVPGAYTNIQNLLKWIKSH